MDEESSTSAEKNDKFSEFLSYSKCWTLKQDKELKDALQSTVSGMLDAIRHFENVGKALESEIELFECRFENIHNRIGCLKMERLVKEQVDEIPVDLLRGRSKKSCRENLVEEVNRKEYEQQTINTISNAIRRGFELFDIQQDKPCGSIGVDTQNKCDPSDPSTKTELPKEKSEESVNAWDGIKILRSFERSELPPIIGSADFYEAMRRANETEADSPTANERRMAKNSPSLPAPITATTKIEEEDIASVSSGRSAPPQDPVVVQQSPSMPAGGGDTLTMRTALMEEITERARKREEENDNTEKKERERCDIGRQTMRVEEKRKMDEKLWSKDNEKERPKRGTGEQQQQGNERVTDKQRQLMAENIEIKREIGERHRIKEVTEQRQRKKRRSGERRVRKSLFSSSSSEEEAEGEEEEEPFNTSVNSLRPLLEDRTHKLTKGPDSNLGRSLSQRPLSVQSFGSCVGDGGLITSADHSTTIAGQSPALVRKTESATTVSVVSNNEEFGPTSVKNRIAQIGARIPVGKRTADGARREDDEQRTERTTATATNTAAPLPTEAIKTRAKAPSARRAPSQRIVNGKPPLPLSSSAAPLEAVRETLQQQKKEEEKRPTFNGAMKNGDEDKKMLTRQQPSKTVGDGEQQSCSDKLATKAKSAAALPQAVSRTAPAKTVPPPVKPKTTARSSIFSSSSSDDDLGFSKVIGTTKATVQPQQKSHVANELSKAKPAIHSGQQQKPPPFSYKKTAAPAKIRKKGLFDDSDSDF